MDSLFNAWYKWSIGKPINVDGAYGNQCVDVDLAWAEYLFPGVPWYQSIGYGNAKDLYAAASTAYFEKIPYSAGVVPRKGDIFVKDGTAVSNPEGHTGVVIDANASTMSVIQQNGYNPSGVAYTGDLSYSKIIGFLRPRIGQQPMPADKYDTVPKGDDVGIHYRKRMDREATDAEKANRDNLTWSQILDDNVSELQARLRASENSTKEYTKPGVISYLQNNLS